MSDDDAGFCGVGLHGQPDDEHRSAESMFYVNEFFFLFAYGFSLLYLLSCCYQISDITSNTRKKREKLTLLHALHTKPAFNRAVP
jgi:hypothetical protein